MATINKKTTTIPTTMVTQLKNIESSNKYIECKKK